MELVQSPAQTRPPRSNLTRRVLIVDDEPRIRLALRACLEAEGYAVFEAADGTEALNLIEEQAPQVMLLDLAMPRLDGLSTLEELARRQGGGAAPGAMPKVIVLTAYGSVSSRSAALVRGAAGFLEKPVLPDVLRQAVARVLDDASVASI